MKQKKAAYALWLTQCVLLLALTALRTQAQIPFTQDDWTLDRGSATVSVGSNYNGLALRQGYNAFQDTGNNPLHSVRRWVWPASADLQNAISANGVAGTFGEVTDNPNPLDTNKSADTGSLQFPTAIAQWNTNIFSIPAPALRVPYGGYSFITDPTNPVSFDYGVAVPIQTNIDDANGNVVSAQTLEALPYVNSTIYSNVQTALVNDTANSAQYSMGTPVVTGTLQPGQYVQVQYEVQVWSPGDGTTTVANGVSTVHPNVQHVFVRVSWNGTVNNNAIVEGSGTAGAGGINDPENSRIYLMDFSGGPGWRTVGAFASGNQTAAVQPALFPYRTDQPGNQPAVTIYRDTPDNPNDTNIYANTPLVTADAVQFVPVSVQVVTPGATATSSGNLGSVSPISPIGRILAPIVGTNQLITNTKDLDYGSDIYFAAREETIPPTAALAAVDPTQTTLTSTNDPNSSQTVPVFYCLNNMDEAVTQGTTVTNAPSEDRVRWRYVATPDAGTGTCIASPLLANVRCRDGVVRPMVFFVTTNAGGTLGHIYALNPLGTGALNNPLLNRPSNPPVGYTAGDLTNYSTSAYWIYPSFRPLLGTANEPPNAPAAWEDPNYTLPINTGGYARTGYPAAAFGADLTLPNYDGDIVATGNASQPYATRTDTQIVLGGMPWAPALVNDPDNPAGAQLLVVGAQANASDGLPHSRIWAFDAGGRGDFGTVTSNATGTPTVVPAAGTTQRIFTWPHFGTDGFHYANSDTANGYTQTFSIADEAPLGLISGSPAFDPNYPGAEQPIMFGTSDGRMYAVLPHHDVFKGINTNNQALYDNSKREYWVYPALSTAGFGAGFSTPAFYQSTKTGNRYLTFTSDLPDGSGGRVYMLPEDPVTGVLNSQTPVTNTLTWVYPPTPVPPAASATDPTTNPLSPGFGSSAPMPVNSGTVNTLLAPYGLSIPYDMVYVVQNDGTVDAIEADPAGDGNGTAPALYSSSPAFTDSTTCTPMATQIISQAGNLSNTPISADANNALPALMFADNGGSISAFGLNAIDDGTGTGTTLLPALWQYTDASNTRIASAALVNGYVVEGDLGGQLHAYSNGLGANGLNETVPPSETLGGNSYYDTVDLRTVNYYKYADWKNFMLPTANGGESPAVDASGNPLPGAASPIPATPLPRNGVPADWGDTLYVAAWGVYHAQPTQAQGGNNNGTVVTGLTAPRITVTFSVLQPDSTQRTTITVPAEVIDANHSGWPADLAGIALGGNYQIAGWDNGLQTVSLLSSTAGQNVYPWVAVYQLPIHPDAQHPFTPGLGGVRISARATITQTVSIQNNGRGAQTQTITRSSIFLRAGQHDSGLVNTQGNGNFTTGTPNNRALRGRVRPLFVTNPLALSTAGEDPAGQAVGANGIADNTGLNVPFTVGWAGSVQNPVGYLQDLFGNGAAIGWFGSSTYKDPLAPLDMTPDGSSVQYQGMNAAGSRVPALYVMDRSAYYEITGSALQYSVSVPSFEWYGGASSVMNPLPWETMPGNGVGSADYPPIPSTAVTVTGPDGVDTTRANGTLLTPTQPINDTNVIDRVLRPTQLTFAMNVPRYQPANVNAGLTTFNGTTFGAGFTTLTGQLLGSGSPVLGPALTYGNGQLPATANANTFPALGYIAPEIQVSVHLPGTQRRVIPPNGFNSVNQQMATRVFTSMVDVPPSFRMNVSESTVDLGNEPAGTGYSPVNGNGYSLPFAPSGVGVYQAGIISPWDNAAINGIGKFFHPFTLNSESNVNLVNLRIADLFGVPGASITPESLTTNPLDNNVAVSARLTSDQVDQSLTPWLLGVPFGRPGSNASGSGLGNIGYVSSFDHASSSDASTSAISLYPVNNSTYLGGLTNNWPNSLQPVPTLHKPLPGDSQGTVATVPDVPHNYTGVVPPKPEIGIAIPYGTPVGSYSGKVIAYEDELPVQWQWWLANTINPGVTPLPVSNDGILNTTSTQIAGTLTDPTGAIEGGVLEPFAQPFNLHVNVISNRLTNGVAAGSLSQMDLVNPLAQFTSAGIQPGQLTGPFNTLPAVQFNANGANSQIVSYFTSNRPVNGAALVPGQAGVYSSVINLPYNSYSFTGVLGNETILRGDASFSTANAINSLWWTPPSSLLAMDAATTASLFPSTGDFSVPGTPALATLRYGDAAVAQGEDIALNGGYTPYADAEGYLAWLGQVDKNQGVAQQQIDERIFLEPVTSGVASGGVISFPVTGNLPNSSVRPLLAKFMASDNTRGTTTQKMLFLFWSAGGSGSSRIYYDVNAYSSSGQHLNLPGDAITSDGWITTGQTTDPRLGVQQLSLPASVTAVNDPSPVYRQVVAHNPFDPGNSADVRTFDCVDVYFSGKLRGRGGIRLLMARYGIYRGENLGPNAPVMRMGQLFLMPLPSVVNEQLVRRGDTNTWVARDADWYTGVQPGAGVNGNGAAALSGEIYVQLEHLDPATGLYGAPLNLNVPAGTTIAPAGTYDPASGVVYFKVDTTNPATGAEVDGANNQPILSGGVMVVNASAGTVTFPNIPPASGDKLLVSYQPQVRDLSVSRGDSNLILAGGYGNFAAPPSNLLPQSWTRTPGDAYSPSVLLDTSDNPRRQLLAPVVTFLGNGKPNAAASNGTPMPVDRLWVIYRKTDTNGAQKQAVYAKAMRLMVRLPYPVELTAPAASGLQQIASLTVTVDPHDANPSQPLGMYEVDWMRGRIYFTTADAGRLIDVNYTPAGGGVTQSGTLVYRVAWGDEISTNSDVKYILVNNQPVIVDQNGQSTADTTTPEALVPMSTSGNEGEVAALLDPYLPRIWLFWSGTDAGSTDLYSETIAPQLYPQATNQH